jgi:glycosyltransferase involved in cell wall biosynthesis
VSAVTTGADGGWNAETVNTSCHTAQRGCVSGHLVSIAASIDVQYCATHVKVLFTDHSLVGFADPASIALNKALKFTLADAHAIICVSHTSRENTVLRACLPPRRVYVIPNGGRRAARCVAGVMPSRRSQCCPYFCSRGSAITQFTMLPTCYLTAELLHHCWPAAVDATQFMPEERQQQDSGRVTVVALSRLTYRKGVDLLNVVVPAVCRRHPHVDFIIGQPACPAHPSSCFYAAASQEMAASQLLQHTPDPVKCHVQRTSCRGCSPQRAADCCLRCTAGGDGPMAGMLRDMIRREDLSDRVTMLGAVPTQDVRNVLVRGCCLVCQNTESA